VNLFSVKEEVWEHYSWEENRVGSEFFVWIEQQFGHIEKQQHNQHINLLWWQTWQETSYFSWIEDLPNLICVLDQMILIWIDPKLAMVFWPRSWILGIESRIWRRFGEWHSHFTNHLWGTHLEPQVCGTKSLDEIVIGYSKFFCQSSWSHFCMPCIYTIQIPTQKFWSKVCWNKNLWRDCSSSSSNLQKLVVNWLQVGVATFYRLWGPASPTKEFWSCVISYFGPDDLSSLGLDPNVASIPSSLPDNLVDTKTLTKFFTW
jgi:hypothetical protein